MGGHVCVEVDGGKRRPSVSVPGPGPRYLEADEVRPQCENWRSGASSQAQRRKAEAG